MSMSSSLQDAHVRGVLATRRLRYPVVLPTVRDPRLHLAAVIVSLQVLGQVAFDFRLSIAQILIAIGTCAILEVAIVVRRQQVLMWPASALLTGNGVAFILRVPGTEHGDWWSTNGWWIFAGTAAVSLLSKYLIRFRGAHVFNPSNLGLVLCFLLLGPELADPLDFWWGPMSPALLLALAIIVVGALAILSRLHLLAMALAFWLVFAAAVAVVAATGHGITARWHLGPVEGTHLWTILAFSPEILVFLFFMLTDPRTVPKGRRARIAFAVAVALLAALFVALAPTEFWAKVGVLAALTLVCAVRPLAVLVPSSRVGRRGARLGGVRGSRCIRGDVDRDRRRYTARSSGCRSGCRAGRAGSSRRRSLLEGRRFGPRPGAGATHRGGHPGGAPCRSAPRDAMARGSRRSVPRDRRPARRGVRGRTTTRRDG